MREIIRLSCIALCEVVCSPFVIYRVRLLKGLFTLINEYSVNNNISRYVAKCTLCIAVFLREKVVSFTK